MATQIIVQGDAELMRRLEGFGTRGQHALMQSIYEEVELGIFPQTQIEVPVHFGTLRGSGFVSIVSDTEVQLVYGGPSAPYAVYVHEMLGIRHHPPTKAKFVEDPVNRALAHFTENVSARVADKLGSF